MSSNPEQLPKSSESNIPHSGESVAPDASRIKPGISAPDTVYEGFENRPPEPHERTAWDQKKADVRDSVTTAPEKKKPRLTRFHKILLGAGALSAIPVLALSLGVKGVIDQGGDGKNRNLPPEDNPTSSSAPVTPGETPSAAVETPAPTEVAGVPVEQLKFSNGNGTYATYETLTQADKISIDAYPKEGKALEAMFEKIEDSINYFPDKETVSNNVDKPIDQLTRDDYMAVLKQRQEITLDTLITGSGPLRSGLERIGTQAAFTQFEGLNSGDPVAYQLNLSFDDSTDTLTITDNSKDNTIDDNVNRDLGEYKLQSNGVNDLTIAHDENNNGWWQLSGGIGLKKTQ